MLSFVSTNQLLTLLIMKLKSSFSFTVRRFGFLFNVTIEYYSTVAHVTISRSGSAFPDVLARSVSLKSDLDSFVNNLLNSLCYAR